MKYPVGERVQVKYWLQDYFVWRTAKISAHDGGAYVVCVEDQSISVEDDEIRLPSVRPPEPESGLSRGFHDDHTFVYLAASPGKGRGVFARKGIAAGTTILVDPVIILSPEEFDLLGFTALSNHVFRWSSGQDGDEAELYCIAFGLGSMINHASPPNVRGRDVHAEQVIAFDAIRDIAPDEELFLDYGIDEHEKEILGIDSAG